MEITQADVLNLFIQAAAIKNSDQILIITSNNDNTVSATKITAEVLKAYLCGEPIDLTEYAKKIELDGKQDKLVSGANVKTINGTSILGSGNISISGGSGSGGDVNVIESISVNGNPVGVSDDKNVDIIIPDVAGEYYAE